jgi:hypothetical protein
MALIPFDSENETHSKIFTEFKTTLVDDCTCSKDDLLAQSFSYIDTLEMMMRDLAVEELDCHPDIADSAMDSYWSAAITNADPTNFGIICTFEYIDYDSDDPICKYIKCEGEILIEDDTSVVLDIDPTSLDYSNSKEYNKIKGQ